MPIISFFVYWFSPVLVEGSEENRKVRKRINIALFVKP